MVCPTEKFTPLWIAAIISFSKGWANYNLVIGRTILAKAAVLLFNVSRHTPPPIPQKMIKNKNANKIKIPSTIFNLNNVI